MSEDEEEEDDEEESEEELLALRRDGWVLVSVAGFSAEERKRRQSVRWCIFRIDFDLCQIIKQTFNLLISLQQREALLLLNIWIIKPLEVWRTYVWS